MRTMILAASTMLLLSGAAYAQVNSTDLKWGPAPAVFPAGAKMAVLSGDPSKSGVFVIRLKMPANYAVAAHHHSTAEYVTLISGEFHLGMGDKLDKAKGATLHPGGFAEAPAGMNHFAWATKASVVQISAEGPFNMVYVNPADDPSVKH
jgi:uncharacterized RmlC-like cupin family protein